MQVDHKQHRPPGIAEAAIAKNGHPLTVGQHADLDRCRHITQVAVGRVAELPAHRAGTQIGCVGDIQRKHRPPARAQRTQQVVAPTGSARAWGIDKGIGLHQRTIDEILVVQQPGAIGLVAQFGQIGVDRARHIGEHLATILSG